MKDESNKEPKIKTYYLNKRIKSHNFTSDIQFSQIIKSREIKQIKKIIEGVDQKRGCFKVIEEVTTVLEKLNISRSKF